MAYPFVRNLPTKRFYVRGEEPTSGALSQQGRAAGVLREPLLYLSLYFKQNRPAYYDLLNAVRAKGDWETCLDFFLIGVRDTSEQAAGAARLILAIFAEQRRKIEVLGRPAASVCSSWGCCGRSPAGNATGSLYTACTWTSWRKEQSRSDNANC